MRKYLFPAAFSVGLAFTSVAFAAHSATGEIKAFDLKAHTLRLSDGTVYSLPRHFKDPGLKVGEKVSINWNLHGGKHQASTVTILR